MSYIISIFFILYIMLTLTLIALERKQPEKTIAWLLIFVLFPPLGIILYLFLGRNWKIHKLPEDFSPTIKELINNAMDHLPNMEYFPLIQLIAKNSHSPLYVHNEIKILNNGEEKFALLKEEFKKAKHHIHMEYYIVKSDTIGNELKDILIEKALEGVKVRIIMDRVGSIFVTKAYLNELRQAGVDVIQYSYFLAPLLKIINTQINFRNHRKIVVIDGLVGFVGGINIGDEYLGKGKLGYWRDTHLMVRGDFVLGLQAVFIDDYITIKNAHNELSFQGEDFKDYFKTPSVDKGKVMQLVRSGPDSKHYSIEQAIIKMITLAKKHIYITSPYFVPSESLLNCLKIASLGGIDVKILFPGTYDHLLVYYASRTYLAELSTCGVEVYLYNPSAFIHSKLITVDGKICTIGTANMDRRSFELNYEINAVIYDKEVTEELEIHFFKDLKDSRKISPEEWAQSSYPIKLLESFCRIFSSLL
ncbi:MAG: cardiolipin synthase [Clostridia bacterium]|nr:cardiolipin synthase [Clostridia bacterium]